MKQQECLFHQELISYSQSKWSKQFSPILLKIDFKNFVKLSRKPHNLYARVYEAWKRRKNINKMNDLETCILSK